MLAVAVTLISPRFVDPTWTHETSHYQKQLYEFGDGRVFISNSVTGTYDLQFVNWLEEGKTLTAFVENERQKIVAPEALKSYITKENEPIKLTSHLLLLKSPGDIYKAEVEKIQVELKKSFIKSQPEWEKKGLSIPAFDVFELYEPKEKEAFATSSTAGNIEDYIDQNFLLVEEQEVKAPGYFFARNPLEYRVKEVETPIGKGFRYSPQGRSIASLEDLKKLGFWSRKDLIEYGERIYAIEGCWYCHTDQTRTLVQDVVLNGSDSYPAPPSSAGEYIYQNVTFPGTRRIGPDLSRTGVKRPSRDWHRSHFWSPKTASPGSVMPSFQHFFDDDPRGTPGSKAGVPNLRFEAIYQYLMTKGTRITSPSQAWWLGKDPVKTKEIIEGLDR
jgi:cytochrome c oxidase cbb3-type subunit 2